MKNSKTDKSLSKSNQPNLELTSSSLSIDEKIDQEKFQSLAILVFKIFCKKNAIEASHYAYRELSDLTYSFAHKKFPEKEFGWTEIEARNCLLVELQGKFVELIGGNGMKP